MKSIRTHCLTAIAVLTLSVIVLFIQACGRASVSKTADAGRVAGATPSEAAVDARLQARQTPRLGDIPLYGELFKSSGGVAAGNVLTAVAPGEEVWVIARTAEADPQAAAVDTDDPGCGALVCVPPGATDDKEIPLPLEHTDVKAGISGYIASVTVRQEFRNPYDGKIEAVYVFPLPENAAVSEFVMVIGDRRIRGIIREREEAEQIYYEARRQGHTASLLTQERPNIFTQRVANIEPGKQIDVELTYFNTLAYSDGWYHFVFPMVVGPRFNPRGSSNGVGAVARGERGSSGQSTEVTYLEPGERSGHDIALAVEIDAGVPVQEITSVNHVVNTQTEGSSRAVVTLSPRDSVPNKDFVLSYRVAGETPQASVLTHRDDQGGYFTLMLYPPRELSHQKRAPIEMIFVLDCSGSMRGEPLAKARRAVERTLHQLGPDDTFQVIRFSNDASTLGPRPLPATDANVRKGLRYVKSLKADGGTMMIRGIKAALDFPHDPRRLRFVTFMTDGYIGNETEILAAVHEHLGDARIFSFGVGSSPNRYLMNRMAKLGRGAATYVGLNDNPTQVMDLFIDRIRHPAMTHLSLEFEGMEVDGLYPQRLPDLFVGRPVVLTGRFEGEGEASVRISGRVGEERMEIPVTFTLDDASTSPNTRESEALPKVWARMKIADLADRSAWENDPEAPDAIRDLALDYGLMSAYTAFVAVDSSRVTDGSGGTTVPVAVPVPDGVRYDTTVANNGS